MITENKMTQLSEFPKREPGRPGIFAERVGNYPCFCINDIYIELFAGEKTKAGVNVDSACIYFPHSPYIIKKDKDLLAFLLPSLLFEEIANITKDGKEYVKDYDYREFFLKSTNNNKITRLLFKLFSTSERDSEKRFIELVQAHFVQFLSEAEFQQPQLKEHLCNLVDGSIAPESISPTANAAFHALVDSEEHDATSKAIANVFVSAMLGLYSMKYNAYSEKSLGYKRKRDFVFVRTYLLNRLGMEFIWTPETISNSYVKLQDALYSYECALYEEAYTRTLSWMIECSVTAQKTELAAAYHVLGACLYLYPTCCTHVGLTTDNLKKLKSYIPNKLLEEENNTSANSKEAIEIKKSAGITLLEKCISLDRTLSGAFYILYCYYKSRDEKARADGYLRVAFDSAFSKAVIEVANRYIKGQSPLTDVAKENIFEKLTTIISNEQNYSEVDVSECLYLRGRLSLIPNSNNSNAAIDFETAAKKGHEKARQELSRKERIERQKFPSFSDDSLAPCCFANSLDGNNTIFLSTIPDRKWALFTTEQHTTSYINSFRVKDVDEFIEKQHFGDFDSKTSQTVFLFMSLDEDRNLNECLMLLDKLFNIALRMPEKQRNEFIDQIKIYVGVKYEMASKLIDANINDMGDDIFFKIYVVDESRDSAHQLLCDAPLFMPLLSETKHETSINVVLFGCSETNYSIIKESIGCAYLGKDYPISITMLGTCADRMERRLRQECPGLFHESRIECIRPKFISCCIEEEDFPNIIYGSIYDEQPDNELVKTLGTGNYFVVDLSSDHDSIRFAMELRTWLLRSRGTFDRTPFIGVKCKNSQNSYLASHLTLSGQAAGDTYYSRYDLFPFGISRELYSFNRLIENPRLEEVALQIHKSYYGGNDRQAENDYYSFSYNADSSLLTAIGIGYRLFAGGSFFAQKEQYLNCGVFDSVDLLKRYVEAIKSKEELAASLEQSRWNGFMLSRGWETADINQVRAYKDQSTGFSHKHTLAKLHPFIREWHDLDSDDLLNILGMLQSKFDYDKHPKSTTRKSIKDTPKFLEKPIKDNEKRH